MNRERIADDIYVFTSRRYAQVIAGAVLTKEGVVLIDTLFYPDETRAVKQFLEDRLSQPVRYIIHTHHHADHTMGTYLFPHAQVSGHELCRQLLDSVGRAGLERTREQLPEFAEAEVVLPDLVFATGELSLHIGGKSLILHHMPGHSKDLVGVMVESDHILFASDNMMPVPTIFDGDYDDLVRSLKRIREMRPDTIVQGHGEVILRGEVRRAVRGDLDYLETIRSRVRSLWQKGRPESALAEIDIESCGKSRIPLNGFVSELHQANLHKLYHDYQAGRLS